MYKIEVYNTFININNYNIGDCITLENNFRVYNKANFTSSYNHILYNLETKTLTIPRGVDIPYIENLFQVKAFIHKNSYDRYMINNDKILLKFPPKDDKQRTAINFLTGNDQYKYTSMYSQLMIALDTGSGKTYLAIAYMAITNIKSIIITASINWLNQWKERILYHSNITSKEIYFIHGTTSIKSLLNKSQEELSSYKVYLVTHGTIQSMANSLGWDKLHELFIHLGIGIKIFDEAHLNFENISHIDYATNTYKTLYLTATPSRGDEDEDRIFKLYFKNVPKLVLFDPDIDPHTNYIAIHYNSRLNPLQLSKCMNRYGFSKTNYCDEVIKQKNFEYALIIIMNMISTIPGKTLIFLATNNSIIEIYNWLLKNYPEYGNNIGIFSSINPNKEDALKCNIILTTSKSAGAAVDIENLTCSVQLAEPIKSEPQNKQRFGRTRCYNSLYIDLIDNTSSVIKKYYMNNLYMFNKYALSVKEIKINDKELENLGNSIIQSRCNGINPYILL